MTFHSGKLPHVGLVIFTTMMVATFGLRADACTIAVVSGRATDDGRPLLWKNRDTQFRRNELKVFNDGMYRVLAVVNAGNSGSAWMGLNEAGLCLLNAVARDLPGGSRKGPGNGSFMKRALQKCANVAELETLLEETNDGRRRTKSNFAAIDADGAAVIFEAGHRSFVKFDANDPETAAQGYIVRTNFAMTAKGTKYVNDPEGLSNIYSGERYLRAERLFQEALQEHGHLSYRFILQDVSRDLSETLDAPLCALSACESLDDGMTSDLSLPEQINTESTINRETTVSASIFHGVKPGESPQWSTMWTLLGQPAFSVAVPCWLTSRKLPPLLTDSRNSPLCQAVWQVRQLNYTSRKNLRTHWLTTVWSRTLRTEHDIIRRTEDRLRQWRTASPALEKVARFQDKMVKAAVQSLLTVQGEISKQPVLAEKAESRSRQRVTPNTRQATSSSDTRQATTISTSAD